MGSILSAVLAVSACGGGAEVPIRADDYDRTCETKIDCMVIYTGSPCDCKCNADAINVADREAYFMDRNSSECDESCDTCQGHYAECRGAMCVAEQGR